ncbi:MAG: helix-turn-helix transcriptional regulator [Lachnospiraceae bacterium]|nr:helix-turn-helix transcriptional regulator [Lachnospiraceae bacterium]
MRIEQFLKDKKISLYALAEKSGLNYSVVHNIINGRSDIRQCKLDTAARMADALQISIEDLMLLCKRNYSYTLFKSEQCHQVHRKGELEYVVDILERKEIDHYWHLSMYAEALYELAMIDYICRRNDIPKCENYNEMRTYKLDHKAYPIDVEITKNLLRKDNAYENAEKGAIPEFLRFNIIEGEIFDDER